MFEGHLRTYIWVGKYYPDKQPDGTPHPQAGQPEWCFAYGEKEWLAGADFESALEKAEGNVARGIPPKGRKNCTTGENL